MAKQSKPLLEKIKIEYEDYYCAFIDVLGFSNLLREGKNAGKLEDYFQVVSEAKSNLKSGKVFTIALSDSIILLSKRNKDKELETLKYFLLVIQILQCRLNDCGIWIRGGISLGPIYFNKNENIVVGEGFLRAIEMEKLAKFPRVILDTLIVSQLGFSSIRNAITSINDFDMGDEFSNFAKDALFDYTKNDPDNSRDLVNDIPLFVDFGAQWEIKLIDDIVPQIFSHVDKALSSKVEFYEKYAWLANYAASKAMTLYSKYKNEALLKFHVQLHERL